MENLSHLCGPLPVSSQAPTNTVSDNSAALSAPGSASESSRTPAAWTGTDLGAVRTPTVMHPEAGGAPDPGDPWSATSKTWVEAADESPGGGNLTQLGRWRQS